MTIVWVGDANAPEFAMLRAAGGANVARAEDLEGAFALRDRQTAGFVLSAAWATAGLRRAELADGLARAVGYADCLAFAGGLPGAYGFCARVAGLVQAVREGVGQTYVASDAVIVGSGCEAWASLAAATQLRASSLALATPDAVTSAVAHRLGVELAHPSGRTDDANLVFDAHGPAVRVGNVAIGRAAIALHTVATQVRLLTSKEPDIEAMRRACG
ncbi:MAG: hypothetical protein Q3979_04400 [Actinomycetaceae bacterium]|nr:hypothetical protein [Actinomycetaceae bacterium]